jgi:hypothetical protein
MMGLDIRMPIGWLFLVYGMLLLGYGALSDPAIYERSLGVNINAGWGVAMLLFGAIMLALGRRGSRREAAKTTRPGAAASSSPPAS